MISLYCNCFRDKVNKRVEYNQKNLMLGASNYEPEIKLDLQQKGFLFDDVGNNISDLNRWFGQLTGLYWVWKNTDDEIVGTNTYRLFWGDYFLNNPFKENFLYIPYNGNLDTNIYDQYSYCHGEVNLKFLYELSDKNLIPIKTGMIENLKHQTLLYPFNMFISQRKIYDKLCSLLFDDILFVFFDHYKEYFPEYEHQYNQSRILDFLSERILHMIYTNTDYFFSNLNIETIPVVNLHHSS